VKRARRKTVELDQMTQKGETTTWSSRLAMGGRKPHMTYRNEDFTQREVSKDRTIQKEGNPILKVGPRSEKGGATVMDKGRRDLPADEERALSCLS